MTRAALCALIAVAVGVTTAIASTNGRNVTALVRMSNAEPMSALTPRGFSFVAPGAHYDGVYYYAIARDPVARDRAHTLIDKAAYRYGHPAYGWLAWVASGGGVPAAVPYALVVIGLVGLGIAAFAASLLAAALGMSAWWGLSVALNPGLLFAVTADCSETVALALVLVAILAWMRERWLLAGVALALGCFTKEPLLLLPFAFGVYEAYRRLRSGQRPSQLRSRIAALLAGPVLYAAWLVYCEWVFARLPSSGINQVALPLAGWLTTVRDAWGQLAYGDSQVGSVTAPLLVAFGGALVVGLVRAVRLRGPTDAAFAAFAVLALCTNWLVLLFPKDFLRTAALPIALVPFVVGATSPTPFTNEEDQVVYGPATG
jgi:hypothetical protein